MDKQYNPNSQGDLSRQKFQEAGTHTMYSFLILKDFPPKPNNEVQTQGFKLPMYQNTYEIIKIQLNKGIKQHLSRSIMGFNPKT